MVDCTMIAAFLTRWETRCLTGYVPCDPRNYLGGTLEGYRPIAVSGVTVATGLDLGQQGDADLRRFGFPEDLHKKMQPYLGKTRFNAMEALRQAPLRLTEEECDVVNDGVHRDYIRRAAARYDRAAFGRFADVPAEAQAVVVSLFYQLGSPARYPEGVWDALSAGSWKRAARCLRADDSRYRLRRQDEAALLEAIH